MTPVLRRLPGRRPRWGNLRRARPFSLHYGFDRGHPIDRFYIEGFLERIHDRITGDVLEVRTADYARRFGTVPLRQHVVDIDADNPEATIVGDLCDPGTLQAEAYDCVILTQTLHLLAVPDVALASLWRSLRPGGSLIVTVPCASCIIHELPTSDFWRWTPLGLQRFTERYCEGACVHSEGAGNLVTMLGTFLGLAVEDMRDADLALGDPSFPVVACVAARKPGRPDRSATEDPPQPV